MKRSKRNARQRRGTIVVLAAVLMVALLSMMALAIDVGWIGLTKSDLQNAADAAALAGVQSLNSGYVTYYAPGQTAGGRNTAVSTAEANATTVAQQYAGYNAAGGVSSLALGGSDVSFGYTDNQGTYTSAANYNGYPNTVKVVVRRNAGNNGALRLFFAPIFGRNNTTVTATAASTIYTGQVTSFSSSATCNGLLLPVAYDYNAWQSFLSNGKSPDGLTHNNAVNGLPELQVYPSPGNAPGNFGLLCIGPPVSNAPAFGDWIDNGPSPNDIQYLTNASNNLLPVSVSAPKSWAGGPGMKSTLESNFANAVGKPKLIPLFKPISTSPYQAASGQGSNTYYQIVGFAGVVISYANGKGSNMNISVQPCSVLDPTAIFAMQSLSVAGSSVPMVTTAAPPRLTQ